jgi:alkane 1-monooxygenase
MRPLRYLLAYVTPAVVLFSLLSAGWWTFTALGVLFGVIPVLEFFFRGTERNLSSDDEDLVKRNPLYDWILYSMLPIQYGLLLVFLFRVSTIEFSLLTTIGMTISMGLACGVLGINVAHELGHRTAKWEQAMSRWLLLTSLYMHFFIEHNRGHHRHVATAVDPASARYGESIYAFFMRSITGGWISAWRLENKRLRLAGKSFWSVDNQMLQYQIAQLGFCVLIGIWFGGKALLLFLVAAVVGMLLLEAVNYIEHYGLSRNLVNGRPERTRPQHSWNSNHAIGRLLLFELTRHSDHHYMASRKYPLLRHFDHSPQLPTGYPGMMLLALVPPLWFMVMHRQIESYQKQDLISTPA